MLPGRRRPWAAVYTKRPAGVDLILTGPRGAFALGRIAQLGLKRAITPADDGADHVKLRFAATEDLSLGDLPTFLAEHLAALHGAGAEAAAS
jgi:hypothetical protein